MKPFLDPIDTWKEKYEKWWLYKYCRAAGSTGEFKRVIKIEVFGPPSFVYGTAELTFEDGTTMHPGTPYTFKPRKMDVEVRE